MLKTTLIYGTIGTAREVPDMSIVRVVKIYCAFLFSANLCNILPKKHHFVTKEDLKSLVRGFYGGVTAFCTSKTDRLRSVMVQNTQGKIGQKYIFWKF